VTPKLLCERYNGTNGYTQEKNEFFSELGERKYKKNLKTTKLFIEFRTHYSLINVNITVIIM